jgi:hypothetical protein
MKNEEENDSENTCYCSLKALQVPYIEQALRLKGKGEVAPAPRHEDVCCA